MVSSAALQQPVAAEADAAAAEAADRRRVMYEVQWQSASAAAAVAAAPSPGASLHWRGAVLAVQKRTGYLITQVPT